MDTGAYMHYLQRLYFIFIRCKNAEFFCRVSHSSFSSIGNLDHTGRRFHRISVVFIVEGRGSASHSGSDAGVVGQRFVEGITSRRLPREQIAEWEYVGESMQPKFPLKTGTSGYLHATHTYGYRKIAVTW